MIYSELPWTAADIEGVTHRFTIERAVAEDILVDMNVTLV